MDGYTRQDIIKKLEANRTIKDKFQTEEQFTNWCNRNLTYIKQDKKINPIWMVEMKSINQDWKDKEYYSPQDANTMHQELLKAYDEYEINIETLVHTKNIKEALNKLNITLVNPSARISTVSKELKVKAVKRGYYRMEDANKILDKIKETYRGNKEETDEDRAIEEIKKVYKERDDFKIECAKLKAENEKLKEQLVEQQETITRQQGTIAKLENKHTSNKLIDMILGRNRGEVV